ncbi:MAG: fibrobacter succinogenes major paralogous domain-containing protein [bacterium]
MRKIGLAFTVVAVLIFIGCGKENPTEPNTDNFTSVKLGIQVWMNTNLDVDHYRNGDSIPEVRDPKEWEKLKTGAWCYYDNNPANGAIYGKLYNGYAINDPRGLAPKGWHIPKDEEWTRLEIYLGGADIAGGKMKSIGTVEDGTGLWHWSNWHATNESGFSAIPGGWRSNNSTFYSMEYNAYWWSSTISDDNKITVRYIIFCSEASEKSNIECNFGYAVRCIKD